MKRIAHFTLVLGIGLWSLAGCSSGDNGETDPCEGVTCKAHAHCLEGECVCNEGFHEEGGSCLPDDPCRFVVCEDNAHCDDDGACVCNQGYHMQGEVCLPDDACLGVTCGAEEQCVQGVCVAEYGDCCDHGTLDETGAEPVCICEDGYNDADGDLLCGPDDPAEWPPALGDLFNGEMYLADAECLPLPCHDCGYPGDIDLSGSWDRTSTTTLSTCTNSLVQGYDPRAILHNVVEEPNVDMGLLIGTCRWDNMMSPPSTAGTALDNIMAGCRIREEIMGVWMVESEVVTYDPDTDTLSGPARVYVIAAEDRPELGVPCQVEADIVYTRR